ncbi:iron complex transport system substrate-binding protein [Deinobacterium chartae]|uniref:Iron complex transport system substrate-binding protein n=1 Tax=Deinobacterium chartae TaxID=521158 RepID=A0A841I1V4_9DEIO|nr:ABC transporter substrate-binding protein [Deinobacterium chartae]MBB6098298.1 iron complex transport system substrate-binding protein [Deinobacterium chartae]
MKHSLLLSAFLLSSAAFATSYPVTVTDDRGRQVTLEREPKRIVSLIPSSTETLCAIGVCDRIVGVDNFSNYPEQVNRLPKLGGMNANLEEVVKLRPDVVFVAENSRSVEQLERAGLRVFVGTAQTYAEIFEKIQTLGKLVNHERQATQVVANIKRDIQRVEAALKGVRPVSVYFEVDASGYTAGPNSFIGELLKRAGGRNVVPANLGDFPKISPELVLTRKPQVIVGATLEAVSARPGWNTVPAVQARRVYGFTPLERDAVVRPGPRVAQGLEVLARMLHPELRR